MLIWIILIIVPMLFGLYAQMKVHSAYNKNVQIPSRGGITGQLHEQQSIRLQRNHDEYARPEQRGRLPQEGTRWETGRAGPVGPAAGPPEHPAQRQRDQQGLGGKCQGKRRQRRSGPDQEQPQQSRDKQGRLSREH